MKIDENQEFLRFDEIKYHVVVVNGKRWIKFDDPRFQPVLYDDDFPLVGLGSSLHRIFPEDTKSPIGQLAWRIKREVDALT